MTSATKKQAGIGEPPAGLSAAEPSQAPKTRPLPESSSTGVVVCVRPASRTDGDLLNDMFLRCSKGTRYRRFHGFVHALPEAYLNEVLAGAPWHLALVAETDRKIVSLASLRLVDTDSAEIAILVDDAYQHRGLGGAMLRRLVNHADRLGIGKLTAKVLAEQMWTLRVLATYGTCRWRVDFGVVEVTLRLGRLVPSASEAATVASRFAGRTSINSFKPGTMHDWGLSYDVSRDLGISTAGDTCTFRWEAAHDAG